MNKIIILSVLYAVCNVMGAAIIKSKLLNNKIIGFQDFIIFLFDPKIFIALIFIFVSMFFSIKALSLSSFSRMIPIMTGINFIITVLVGVLFFKDKLLASSYIGFVFILFGIFLLSKIGSIRSF